MGKNRKEEGEEEKGRDRGVRREREVRPKIHSVILHSLPICSNIPFLARVELMELISSASGLITDVAIHYKINVQVEESTQYTVDLVTVKTFDTPKRTNNSPPKLEWYSCMYPYLN